MSLYIFKYPQPFELENGQVLPELEIKYFMAGKPSADGRNVIWVCHALTANADVTDWWDGLFGEGKLFDPSRFCIICANVIGSCYGTTGPLSIRPDGQVPYHSFPNITIRDMIKAHVLLRKHLRIPQIHALIGASLGGQQALEWAVQEPNLISHLIAIATNAKHSPWGIAFNEAQRMAIQADATWQNATPQAGMAGLSAARAIAMLSYRSYLTYEMTQQEDGDDKLDHYKASSYQQYQGKKLCDRFNAFSYWRLSKAMDSHHLGRGRLGIAAALKTIQANSLIVSITSDLLFPTAEQQLLAQGIQQAQFLAVDAIYGHDGFLIETQVLEGVFREFLQIGSPPLLSAEKGQTSSISHPPNRH